ncbi:hypothetical protein BS78_01G375300, partial [Paspalum vaginatum]
QSGEWGWAWHSFWGIVPKRCECQQHGASHTGVQLKRAARKAETALVTMDRGRNHQSNRGGFAGRAGGNGTGRFGQGGGRGMAYGQGKQVCCTYCFSVSTHKCPLLKQPRPVAHAVGYAVHGLGFHHIPHPPLPKAKNDNSQLQKLIPSRWSWELKEHEEGFVTQFPSKAELQRSIAFGGADVKLEGVSVGIRLQFSEWTEKEEGYLLPKVWVRVFGIRQKLRELLNMWAVGSMLGSTQSVDMEMTRKNNFGRIFITVLNPRLIPTHLYVVIGDHYFELSFEVEKIGIDEYGDEVELDLSNSDDEGNKEEEEDLMDELEPEPSRELKRSKNSNTSLPEKVGNDSGKKEGVKNSFLAAVQNLSEEEFEVFLKKTAEEILDISVNTVIGEVAGKVIAEDDVEMSQNNGGLRGGSDNSPIVVSCTVVPSVPIDNKMTLADYDHQQLTEVGNANYTNVQVNLVSLISSDKVLEGGNNRVSTPKSDFLVAVAAIPKSAISPTRASPRLAGLTDEHAMARAERMTAKKNLDFHE